MVSESALDGTGIPVRAFGLFAASEFTLALSE
jgi:hypothetical protein